MLDTGLPSVEESMQQQAEQSAYAAEQETYAADDAQNEQAAAIQQEEAAMPKAQPQAQVSSNQYDYWNQGTRPPRTARRRDAGQPTFGPDGRRTFYQSDYYPTPNNGMWTSPDGMFKLATYGQAPAAILGQRLQDIRIRKQQLGELASQFDPYAGIEAVKPQYAKDFNANTQELWNDFLATKIEEHGSRRAALKAIVTPGSEDNWQWRDINRAQNTKGRYINHEVDRAAKDMMDMETGKVRYDEKTHQLAGEVLNALGSYQKGNVGNSKKFEETTRNYERRAEWVSHFKPLDDRVKKFAIERLGPNGVQFDQKGRMIVTSWDDLKYVTDYLDDVADREWETGMWLKDYGSKEEFVKDLKDYYPISVKHNVRTNTIPYPPGGGSGSGGNGKAFAGDTQERVWMAMDDTGRPVNGVYNKPLYQVVDGRNVPFKDKVSLQGHESGSRKEMIPTRIGIDNKGEAVIFAIDPAEVTTTKTIEDHPEYQAAVADIAYTSEWANNKKSLYDHALQGEEGDGTKKEFSQEEIAALKAEADSWVAKRDAAMAKKSELASRLESTISKEKTEVAYKLKGNEAVMNAALEGKLQKYIDDVTGEWNSAQAREREQASKRSPNMRRYKDASGQWREEIQGSEHRPSASQPTQGTSTTSGAPAATTPGVAAGVNTRGHALGDRVQNKKTGKWSVLTADGWRAEIGTPATASPAQDRPVAQPAATKPAAPATPAPKATAHTEPIVHTPQSVRDTLTAKPATPKDGFEAMQDRVNQNMEPGIYNFRDQQQADSAFMAQNTPRTKDPRTATETDPKGFFKEGRIIKSDMGGKKVYYIVNKSGMAPLSDYFEDEESAKLVLDAFNRGEILEKFLSKRSRVTQKEFEKLVNKK